jgi:hypothetical protein
MTCIHDQSGLLAIVLLFLFAAAAGEVPRLDVIFAGFSPGALAAIHPVPELEGHSTG